MNCIECNRPSAPQGYRLPIDRNNEKQYCTCIKWETLSDSIKLCLDNAERLYNDAELLLDKERFVSSAVLVTFGKEELGKAILMIDYWASRRNLSYKEYMRLFRLREAHNEKLIAAGRAFLKAGAQSALGDFIARQERLDREKSLYVDYNFASESWTGPVQDFTEMFQIFGTDLKEYNKMRRAMNGITKITQSQDIRLLRKTISLLRDLLVETAPKISNATPEMKPVLQSVVFVSTKRKLEVSSEFSTDELIQLLKDYAQRMSELDKNPARDKKWDWTLIGIAEIESYLAKLSRAADKNALLLYEIGLLRMNLYNEYSARASELESIDEYKKAAETLNEYASLVSMKFARVHNYVPSFFKRLLNSIARSRQIPMFDYRQNWMDSYKSWQIILKYEKDPDMIRRRYYRLRSDFNMLYAMSWSSGNFPRIEE